MYNGELNSSLQSLLSVMCKNEISSVREFAIKCRKQLESAISSSDITK